MHLRGEFSPNQLFSSRRTSLFADGVYHDFVFGKVGVEKAERQKNYIPPVLKSCKKFLHVSAKKYF